MYTLEIYSVKVDTASICLCNFQNSRFFGDFPVSVYLNTHGRSTVCTNMYACLYVFYVRPHHALCRSKLPSPAAGWLVRTESTSIISHLQTLYFIYGHTKQKALHPVRSAKLSCLGPRQYYGGGPHGNPRCRRSFVIFLPNFSLILVDWLISILSMND